MCIFLNQVAIFRSSKKIFLPKMGIKWILFLYHWRKVLFYAHPLQAQADRMPTQCMPFCTRHIRQAHVVHTKDPLQINRRPCLPSAWASWEGFET
jgi:hypothetical protein